MGSIRQAFFDKYKIQDRALLKRLNEDLRDVETRMGGSVAIHNVPGDYEEAGHKGKCSVKTG